MHLAGPSAPSWVLAESAASALFSLLSMLLIGLVIGPRPGRHSGRAGSEAR